MNRKEEETIRIFKGTRKGIKSQYIRKFRKSPNIERFDKWYLLWRLFKIS